MKYWEEFQSKWGFGDGDSIPPDACAIREVYVREINKLAAKRGSGVRLMAYDRSGMHNCYLITRVLLGLVKGIAPNRLCIGQFRGGFDIPVKYRNLPPPEDDSAMKKAIQEAYDMNLDSYVQTTGKQFILW